MKMPLKFWFTKLMMERCGVPKKLPLTRPIENVTIEWHIHISRVLINATNSWFTFTFILINIFRFIAFSIISSRCVRNIFMGHFNDSVFEPEMLRFCSLSFHRVQVVWILSPSGLEFISCKDTSGLLEIVCRRPVCNFLINSSN